MSTLYEKSFWRDGVLVENPSWYIGMLLTRHAPDCRVLVELRRSVGKGLTSERRLELAREAACTCGSSERQPVKALTPISRDRRDNRDPQQVGEDYLNGRRENAQAEDADGHQLSQGGGGAV